MTKTKDIPAKAHPLDRREPLPWEEPKSKDEDPVAPQRVAAIVASPSYRRADEDVDFMATDGMRGVRLQIDYLKPELAARGARHRHTIVVFGSTRISSRRPHSARWSAAAANSPPIPGRGASQRRLARGQSACWPRAATTMMAREFGRLVAHQDVGADDSRVVVTGGGPGIMEAANRGAFDAGAKSVGLNITLPHEQYPNPYITPELCFRFHYFAMRKLHFLMRAKALVAFPGGYGTFDELFEMLTLVQTRKIEPMPVVLVGESYWRRAVDFDFLVDEGVIDPEDRELFWFAETAQDIWDGIQAWHSNGG